VTLSPCPVNAAGIILSEGYPRSDRPASIESNRGFASPTGIGPVAVPISVAVQKNNLRPSIRPREVGQSALSA
jgi:hypothetical protein